MDKPETLEREMGPSSTDVVMRVEAWVSRNGIRAAIIELEYFRDCLEFDFYKPSEVQELIDKLAEIKAWMEEQEAA